MAYNKEKLETSILWNSNILTLNQSIDQRWLDNGCDVEFSVNKRTSRNIEFTINNHPNILIWFSQLAECFVLADSLQLTAGTIVKKDGSEIPMFQLRADEFADYANNKTSRVKKNSEGAVFKFKKTFMPQCTYGERLRGVKDLIEKGDYNEAGKCLRKGNMYTLIEI